MLPQLICLPPAGAGPSLYQPWIRQYSDRLDVFPATLPGREARLFDPLPTSLEALADLLVDQLVSRLSRRYALFGYSMGAALSYEICRKFAERGIAPPEILFLLAANPPDRLLDRQAPIHKLESAEFRRELKEIGGTPDEILDNAEAMSLFEPVLRNDFRLCETYEYRPGPNRIVCPAHAFVADRDHLVSAQSAAGWRAFLSGPFTLHHLTGAHMLDRETFAAFPERLLALWAASRPHTVTAGAALRGGAHF